MSNKHWNRLEFLNFKRTVNFLIIAIIIYLSGRYLFMLSNEISVKEVILSVNSLEVKFAILALALTCLNYIVAIFYDVSVSSQLKLKIPFKHLSIISLITFILNNNLGFGAFLGGALRFRFFTRLNISIKNIAKYLVIFSWVYWVGLFLLSSVTFLFIYPDSFITLPFTSIHLNGFWIGAGTGIVLSLFILASVLKDVFKLKWKILFPVASTKRLFIITVISTFDWILLSLIFYFLLPVGKINYFEMLPEFLIAQIGAVTSHVPAGLGVFDSVMIYYFKNIFGLNQLVSTLLIFRIIYFLIPMAVGSSMFCFYEIYWRNGLKQRKEKL